MDGRKGGREEGRRSSGGGGNTKLHPPPPKMKMGEGVNQEERGRETG